MDSLKLEGSSQMLDLGTDTLPSRGLYVHHIGNPIRCTRWVGHV